MQQDPLLPGTGLRRGNGGKKGARIGMGRIAIEFIGFGNLHNFAKIHNRDPVGDILNH